MDRGEILKVTDLKPHMKDFTITFKVVEKEAIREVFSSKTGNVYSVVQLVVGDVTGVIKLVVWDEMIKKFKKGDTYKITGAYTSLFRGHMQLNLSKDGTIRKIAKGAERISRKNNLSEGTHQRKYRPYAYRETI